jgi:hypothetical protein
MSEMTTLTQEVRKVALSNGADLVGFAPVGRCDGAPAELHPRTSLLSSANSSTNARPARIAPLVATESSFE